MRTFRGRVPSNLPDQQPKTICSVAPPAVSLTNGWNSTAKAGGQQLRAQGSGMTMLSRIACHRYGRIRLHADAPCPACGAPPMAGATAAPTTEPFVGRRSELQLLHDALGGALAGRGRVVVLCAEAGIGKTRLAQEVATVALRRGMLALWGRCLEESGAPPFVPWTRAMQGCLRACSDERLPVLLGREAAAAVEIAPAPARASREYSVRAGSSCLPPGCSSGSAPARRARPVSRGCARPGPGSC